MATTTTVDHLAASFASSTALSSGPSPESPARHEEGLPTSSRRIPIVCPGHTRPLAEVQFCSVNTDLEQRCLLISACHDRLPMIRDGDTGDWIGTLGGHKGAVWSAKLDPCGAYLAATASGDFSVKVWDAITGAELFHFPHGHIVKSCDFSPRSTALATGGHEGILRIFPLRRIVHESEQLQQQKKVVDPTTFARPLEIPHTTTTATTTATATTTTSETETTVRKVIITRVAWTSETCLVTGGDDGKIRFWNVGSSSFSDSSSASAAAAPITPAHVLSTDENAEIRDLEIVKKSSRSSISSRNTNHRVDDHDDGQVILTVAAGTIVYFFDLKTYARLHAYKMPIHFRDEGGASLHPTEPRFIAGGSDLWVRVLDWNTGEVLECLKGHHGPIRCLRYAPDGKSFASGSEDGTIRLWKY